MKQTDENATRLYRRALDIWGPQLQIDVAIEECAELIVVLQQYRRVRRTDIDVAEEIADVTIMCQQLRLIYGPERVDRAVAAKLQRLEERLKKEGSLWQVTRR